MLGSHIYKEHIIAFNEFISLYVADFDELQEFEISVVNKDDFEKY